MDWGADDPVVADQTAGGSSSVADLVNPYVPAAVPAAAASTAAPAAGKPFVYDPNDPGPVSTDGVPLLPLLRRLEGSGDDATSPAGAVGRYQIMPATAAGYGFDPTRLKDPAYNEMVATRIAEDLNTKSGGDLDATLVQYNASPKVFRRWLAAGRDDSVLPSETQKYLAHARELVGSAQPQPQGASWGASDPEAYSGFGANDAPAGAAAWGAHDPPAQTGDHPYLASAAGGLISGLGKTVAALSESSEAATTAIGNALVSAGVPRDIVFEAQPSGTPLVQRVGEAIQRGDIAPAKRNAVQSILHGAGEFAPGLGASMLDPVAGAGIFGAQGYAQAADEAKAKGASPEVAARAGAENAAVQAGVSMIPFAKPLEPLVGALAHPVAAALAKVGVHSAADAAMMGTMQAGSNVVAEQNYDPNRPLTQGVGEAALTGALAGGVLHGGREAFNAATGRLRPAETAPGPSGEAPAAPMPATDAIEKYIGERNAPENAPSETPHGNSPVQNGELNGELAAQSANENTSEINNSPKISARATPAISEPAAQLAEDVPAPILTAAAADIDEHRAAAPKGYSLFSAIKDLGGMRVKEPDGSATAGPDVQGALEDVTRKPPGMINNKDGMSPEQMQEALAARGWLSGDDGEAFVSALRQEGSGEKVFHLDSETPALHARRDVLDHEMVQAGVHPDDDPALAAAKLGAWRYDEAQGSSLEMETLRGRADMLGVPHEPRTPYSTLLSDVVEREAIQAEPSESDAHEREIHGQLTPADLERLDALAAEGLTPEHGTSPAAYPLPEGWESEPGVPEAYSGFGDGAERGGEGAAPSAREAAALETQRLGNETVDQAIIPGAERSARQAAAAREGPMRARVDQREPGALFAPPEPEQGQMFGADDPVIKEAPKFARAPFFSAVERFVDNFQQKTATPDQWKATLRNAPGIKKEELDWLGVDDWLDLFKGEKVPKEALQAFLRDNGVQVEEQVLGGTGAADIRPDEQAQAEHAEEWERLSNLIKVERISTGGRPTLALQNLELDRDDLHDRMVKETMDREGLSGEPPQFEDWKLPGGEDYHELLLTLPKEASPPATHWDAPGVMAHVRFDTRTAPDGKKVLFVEEIQSDWHQKARDQGYSQPGTQEEADAAEKAMHEAVRTLRSTTGRILPLADKAWSEATPRSADSAPWRAGWHPGIEDNTTRMDSKVEAVRNWVTRSDKEIPDELHDLLVQHRAESLRANEANQAYRRAEGQTGIPNAPFKSSWPALVMKRVIKWGADHGYDRVAWTTGDQQAQRYSLEDDRGEGMKAFYDRNLVNITNDLIKRYGAKVRLGGESAEPDRIRKLSEDFLGAREASRAPLSNVDAAVSTLRNHDEIVKAISRLLPVDVVDTLSSHGLSPEEFVRDPKVFLDHLPLVSVTPIVDGLRYALSETGARLGAGLDAAFKAGFDREIGGTLRASDVDPASARDLWRPSERRALSGTEPRSRPLDEEGLSAELARFADWHRETLDRAGKPDLSTNPHFDVTDKMREAAQGGFPLFQRAAAPGEGSIRSEPATAADPKTAALIDRVTKIVNRLAPQAEARAAGSLREVGGGRLEGAAFKDGLRHVVAWAVDTANPENIARHEVGHILRTMGLYTKDEWAALTNRAIEDGWLTPALKALYADKSPEVQMEEAIVNHIASDADILRGAPGFVRDAALRVRQLARQIVDAVKQVFGHALSAEDVFSRIQSGEIGRREMLDASPTDARFARKPIDEETRGPAGVINRILGPGAEAVGRQLVRTADRAIPDPAVELIDQVKMGLSPMGMGTERAQASAKDFANALRQSAHQWGTLDQWLQKTFTPEQQQRMWVAADEEGVLRRRGEEPGPGRGLQRLSPQEADAVRAMQARADAAFKRAQDLGMVKGDGLESYVPRMIVEMTAAGPKIVSRATPKQAKRGANLSTTTGQLRQRKYETTEETEAAAKAAFGEGAQVVRNIRTLALATQRLEQAVAGRTLVDKIKAMSKDAGGGELVAEGANPDPANYFTVEGHPALQQWRPKMIEEKETGKWVPVLDQNGDLVFEASPLWVSREFEGPLKAVLSAPSTGVVRALMDLKAKMMSVIMYSPLMHNAVIWGKAIPADPRGVLTLQAYRRGGLARKDPGTMQEAIGAGMDPIGHRYFQQDITGIAAAEGQDLVPGRSWTSQVLSFIPGLFDRNAGEAVKRAVDKFGDVWHNTFLWDRIADLQAGLYVHIRDGLLAKGVDPTSAQRTAAHFANRYAGALPMESMSKLARTTANLALFSRSFTLGNMAAYKDIVMGLPSDVRAQILRDGGQKALEGVQGVARQKAVGMLVLDVALQYAGLTLAAGAVSWLTKEAFQAPWQNELGKENRFLIGYQPDGTAIYGRLPTGKVAEDLVDWATDPRDTLLRKLSPYGRLMYEMASNDRGYGQKLYDPYDHTPLGLTKNVGRVIWAFMGDMAPIGQLEGAQAALVGGQDRKTATLQALAPFTGLTISKGAPGGPAQADIYAARDEQQFKFNEARASIVQQIKAGDIAGARQRMTALGVPPGLQGYEVRVALNPKIRMSRRAIQDFLIGATPDQKARFMADRAAQADRAQSPAP